MLREVEGVRWAKHVAIMRTYKMHTKFWLENIDMMPERGSSRAKEMAVTRLRHTKHHVSAATVTLIIMGISLETVFSVPLSPTMTSPSCRVIARKDVCCAFSLEAT